jgi:hypothetical protein
MWEIDIINTFNIIFKKLHTGEITNDKGEGG